MKRSLVAGLTFAVLAGAAALPGMSFAAYNTNVGCGLGTQLFKEIGQDKILFQVLAVTTNGILGNQTFGITSGTLECQKPTTFVRNEKLKEFVAANMDTIAQDMAAGQGESLVTLAELMEVPAQKRAEFYSSLQANFGKIYSTEKANSAQVIDNIALVEF